MKEMPRELEEEFKRVCRRLIKIGYEKRCKLPLQGFKSKEEKEEFIMYGKMRLGEVIYV